MNGYGSGYEFLRELPKLNIAPKPIIAVNTNKKSNKIYDKLDNITDFIFYKKQKNYSPQLVIDDIVFMGFEEVNKKNTNLINKIEKSQENMIPKLINSTLDYFGISHKLKGRKYIYEAIEYLLLEERRPPHDSRKLTFSDYLAHKHKMSFSGINKSIQTAINKAWRNTDPDELFEKYTQKVNYNTGVPSPTEFVYYCFKKIHELI
ncbi:MAG: sporulation initiation factor Spo0A C-terminal domain-containing protein [Oscillospiraceae bacterium]|nr:sporulation initiation factor Spo0A C-terminal domain-containing protein [Oscillospiraceae bacterium]